ncbi:MULTISPECIES: PP2C family protein-serine/threonine phosphatase [Streptomyces]|uniref:PP2C family protein-serine/threonine phosphatase n=1 Tax=Streptomyces TaxID=1883 RepID=UPI00017F219D|nr:MULTISPECIES: PP2C family protein-serine/threonine phosphatase [Streptomyces]AKL64745.1 stage II sporulation protein E [Streptomyces sp. Mg1]WBY18633.1 PP2C family protein-serine/threonine phosphatase [Streptomyces goshikiensis]WSR97328.1 serine/threonine-protein phosphatase [Streptomyces goshikiensis]
MADQGPPGAPDVLGGLLAASHLMSWRDLPGAVRTYAARAGLEDALIYLADLQERVLVLLPGAAPGGTGADAGPGAGADAELRIDATVAGRAFQLGRVLPQGPGGVESGHQWWLPLLSGTERLGVLRVTTARDDAATAARMRLLATAVALLVVSKRDSSDAHARLVRTREMNVAAEMQWNLTPPQTYADGQVVICGVMEPAYEIGGDAFDYALADDVLHLSVFDAMGHDTSAGMTANLAVATSRNNRRHGMDLARTSEAIEEVLLGEFRRERYVTAVLADLNTRTGRLTWVNRGHHPPVVIRGGRWSALLHCPPGHPMGTDLGLATTVCHEQLEPGDRLVLYTDGITEARNPDGLQFGLDGFMDFLIRHHSDGLPVPETLRRLTHAILDHHRERLADDATVVLAEWLGPDRRTGEVEAIVGLPDGVVPGRVSR